MKTFSSKQFKETGPCIFIESNRLNEFRFNFDFENRCETKFEPDLNHLIALTYLEKKSSIYIFLILNR